MWLFTSDDVNSSYLSYDDYLDTFSLLYMRHISVLIVYNILSFSSVLILLLVHCSRDEE